MAVNVAINGFGRIGRNFFRAAREQGLDLQVVALNDLMDSETAALLLKRDSIHGAYPGTVEATDEGLRIDGDDIELLSVRDPADLPWKELDVDIVVECTGLFRDRESAGRHLEAGADKVVISAPAKGPDLTVVLGANEDDYDPAEHHIISNASCTTNSVVPLAKVLEESFGIEKGLMTTVHAYTGDQQIVDGPHKDKRRARAAAINIVPTTTGAAVAAALALPAVEGRLDGLALRVPVPDGSITDLVCVLEEDVTVDEVNAAYEEAANNGLNGVLAYNTDPIVSSDVVGDPHSCIFDAPSTMAKGNLVKVLGWYDNEWGYSNRLAELVDYVGKRL